MNKLQTIVALAFSLLLTVNVFGQADQPFGQPSQVIDAFLSALSENNDSTRAAKLEVLLAEDGLMNVTLQRSEKIAQQKVGGAEQFLTSTKDFYTPHSIDYQELERSIDYYQDIASVNSLVVQRIQDKALDRTYEQWLWMVFDLAYMNDRWFVTAVSWVNAIDAQPLPDAMLQDTLWHQPEH